MDLYAREKVDVLLPSSHEFHNILTMNVRPKLADVADTKSGKRGAVAEAGHHPPQSGTHRHTLMELMTERQAVAGS